MILLRFLSPPRAEIPRFHDEKSTFGNMLNPSPKKSQIDFHLAIYSLCSAAAIESIVYGGVIIERRDEV